MMNQIMMFIALHFSAMQIPSVLIVERARRIRDFPKIASAFAPLLMNYDWHFGKLNLRNIGKLDFSSSFIK